ncbi:MAG TPA: TIGR03767 family metallophosphoesterase, partial [Marmoricola sp.]|nr:TIGR03767 family metallophosphoesterase [Marmoricola sp.]
MSDISRRSVLIGGVGGLGTAAILRGTSAAAVEPLLTVTAQRAHFTAGTTLDQMATKSAANGYARLIGGPGNPLAVHENLAKAKPGRDDTRVGLASFVQFTDMHIIDAQSPMRFEFLVGINESAYRPQENMGTHGGAQLVARVNSLKKGPFSNRPFDCVVTTGDNTDNMEHIELEWFLKTMSGGTIAANTGAPNEWEGVQTSGDRSYYNIADSMSDDFKDQGFPEIANFFDNLIAPHTSPGLDVPWYCVFGNHDDQLTGVLPAWWTDLNKLFTGDMKFTGFLYKASNEALARAISNGSSSLSSMPRTLRRSTSTVTPDARRLPFTTQEFMAAHRDPAYNGNGPVGHGFSEENVATNKAYYTFRIAPGVTGIAMDSTNRAGWTDGSFGAEQFQWIEQQLKAGSSRYYDSSGHEQHQMVDDELFVVFSHHTSWTAYNMLTDPARPDERRHNGMELVAMLQRFPNVVAWVNGHTHDNKIQAWWNSDPTRSFWEINTASHVDAPQLARIIEICDNADGTLSLFTTCIESDAPYQAPYGDGSQAAIASLYREFAFNNPMNNPEHFGLPTAWNTELLLANPVPSLRRATPTANPGAVVPPAVESANASTSISMLGEAP